MEKRQRRNSWATWRLQSTVYVIIHNGKLITNLSLQIGTLQSTGRSVLCGAPVLRIGDDALLWLYQQLQEIQRKQTQVKKSFVICVLFMAILLWAADAAPRWLVSLFLLAAFVVLRAAPLPHILKFPLSQNFFLIAGSYLFAEGIKKGRLFHIVLPYIQNSVHEIKSLAISILLCGIAAIWVIP